jgi:hypothetical protein
MRRLILLSTFQFLLVGCIESQQVLVEAFLSGNTEVRNIPKDTESFHIGNIHKNFLGISGLEKLEKLKKLELLLVSQEMDISFIEKLNTIEILVLNSVILTDLGFLEKLPNLRILYIRDSHIKDNSIDLLANQKLQYFGFIRSYFDNDTGYRTIRLRNLPTTIQFIDFSLTNSIDFNDELLFTLKKAPTVIVEKSVVVKQTELLKTVNNIRVDNAQSILPQEFQEKSILEKIKEGFY